MVGLKILQNKRAKKFLFAQSQISEFAVHSFRHLRHEIMSQIRWSKREVRWGLEGRWEGGGVTHWSPSNYCLSRSGVGDRVWMEIVTWPEQTNNIAGCKTPPPLSLPLTEEIHRHGIKVSRTLPWARGGLGRVGEGLCVCSLSAISVPAINHRKFGMHFLRIQVPTI